MADPLVVHLSEAQGARSPAGGEPPAVSLAGPGHPPAGSAVGASVVPERLLGILRRKWACPVSLALEPGPKRFGALARAIPGLRRSMLAAEVRRLGRDGLLRRREVSRKPPEVHYSLTAGGLALCRLLRHLTRWEARHL